MKNYQKQNNGLFLKNKHIKQATEDHINLFFDKTNKIKKLMTVDEIAETLTVRPKTIRAWVYMEKIPCVRIGRAVRFNPLAISRWLERQ